MGAVIWDTREGHPKKISNGQWGLQISQELPVKNKERSAIKKERSLMCRLGHISARYPDPRCISFYNNCAKTNY